MLQVFALGTEEAETNVFIKHERTTTITSLLFQKMRNVTDIKVFFKSNTFFSTNLNEFRPKCCLDPAKYMQTHLPEIFPEIHTFVFIYTSESIYVLSV